MEGPRQPVALLLLLLLACMALGLQPVAADAGSNASDRPNLLFMMADQLRWDALGYAGRSKALTPNLDRLAKEGLVMRYSWSSTPTCTPARAALLTGQSPWNHGMLGYGAVADRYPVEMPRVLADSGYRTTSLGKDHFGWNTTTNHGIAHGYQTTQLYDGLGKWDPTAPHDWNGEFDDYDQWFASVMPGKNPQATLAGFDGDGWNTWHGRAYVYDEYYHPTAWLGRKAVSFIQNYSAPDPFFLKVSFHRPHSPYDPPQRVLDMISQDNLPSIITGDAWDKPYAGPDQWCGPSFPDAWCGRMPDNETMLSRRCYYASVTFVDEQIGLIYDALKEKGILENTYIIFTADHGDGQSDHFHWRKGFPYEFSAHVPMMLRWPSSVEQTQQVAVPRGTVIGDLVSELRDVLHTMVDAGNATSLIPSGHFKPEDGKSLLCLLRDPSGQKCDYGPNPGPWRQWIDMEHSNVYNETVHWNALTDGKVKYIFRAFFADEQLFNLTNDPGELHDLAGDPSYDALLGIWRQRLVSQFEYEQRGPDWVKNGVLQQRVKGETYGPNFPHGPAPKAGDGIVLRNNGAANTRWRLDDNKLRLLTDDGNDTALCIANYNGTLLHVEACSSEPQQKDQTFKLIDGPKQKFQFSYVIHSASSMCITVVNDNATASLQACDPSSTQPKPAQLFVFGASGRLCSDMLTSQCLAANANYPSWWANNLPLSLDFNKY